MPHYKFSLLSILLLLASCAAPKTEVTPSLSVLEPTATARSTPTNTPDPLLDYAAWDLIEALPAEHESIERHESPSGKWVLVEIHRAGIRYGVPTYNYDELSLETLDGESVRSLSRSVEIEIEVSGQTPVFIKWSDVRAGLFYATKVFVDGAGLFPIYRDLTYYDPETDEYSGLAIGLSGDLAIAPDESSIAYIGDKDRQTSYFFLLSLVDNSLQAFFLEPACVEQAGGFVWSPDLTRIAFTVFHGTCDGYDEGSLIKLYDYREGALRTLYDGDLDLATLAWDEKGILVESLDEDGNWLLDPATGEIKAAP